MAKRNDIEWYLKTHKPVFANGFRHEVTQAVWPFHNHHEFEIVFFTRGRGTVTFPDGTKLRVEPEGCSMVPSYLAHQTSLELPAETAVVLVKLPEPVPSFFEKVSYVHPRRDPYLINDFMYITAPPPEISPLEQIEFDLRTAALLTKLVRLVEQPQENLDECALYVGMAHDYIQRHFSKIRNLEEISAHVGISYDRLRHLFKKHRGMSLKQFLANLRINHARQLLMLSRMFIKEIAEACGFENEQHFSMYFKKCEGVSPEAYRNSHAKQYTARFSEKPRGMPENVEPASKIPTECLGIKKTKRHGKRLK